MLILLTAFHTLHIFKLSLTDFQNFPGPVAFFQDFPDLENDIIIFQDFSGFPGPVRTLKRMIDGSQMLAGDLIRRSYINETGGIISLFQLYVVKDCTLVSLNHALHRLIITPVSLDITQVSLNNASVTRYIIQHYAD